MSTTTTSTSLELRDDLHRALTASRLGAQAASEIADMLPPAGRAWLINEIARTPYPLRFLQRLVNTTHPDTLSSWLRITTADAEDFVAIVRAATR